MRAAPIRGLVLALVGAGAALVASAQAGGASIGSPQAGWLDGGAELPVTGPGFRFLSPHEHPEAHYGTPLLVAALERAAAYVAAEHPGGTATIGDLSREHGGPMRGHGSHATGRDADVYYYVTDDAGAPLPSRWIAMDGAGRASDGGPERLDAPRVWAFVRALLEDASIEVQAVFMAAHVEALVLAAARRDAPATLVRRAARILQPPGTAGTSPHDEHMHVRIGCPPHDAACVPRHRHGAPEAVIAPLPAGWSLVLASVADRSIVWADGRRIGSSESHWETSVYAMRSDARVVAMRVEAVDGPGGALVSWRTSDGRVIASDASWRALAASAPPAGWERPGFDDSAWPSAVEVAAYGAEPFGESRWLEPTTPARRIWAADRTARVVYLRRVRP